MATAQETANREQYLTFRLGSEAYAVAILRVREIIAYVPMTRVPMTPPYISGVINLRGS
nr:chemotaxis protein CheW [Planctomycetales bacterium]